MSFTGRWLVLVSLVCAATAHADALQGYREARARVEAAVRAHGGAEALAALPAFTVTFEGKRTMIGQSHTFARPDSQKNRVSTTFDFANNRIVEEQQQIYAGGYDFRYRMVVLPTDGFVLNLDKGYDGPVIDRSLAADLPGARGSLARACPAMLLRHALERAATLRPSGNDVLFSEADGTVVQLRFHATSSRLRGFDLVFDSSLLGDTVLSLEWTGSQTVGGVVFPTGMVERYTASPSREGRVRVDLERPADDRFAIPAGFIPDLPPPTEPVQKLAPGVGIVDGLADGNHPFFVEFTDFVAVVEAPSSSMLTEEAIARIGSATGGKPIRYVAFTHPHNDHTAGLRPYIARGVTILSPPVWKPYVEALAAAKHTLRPDRLQASPREPTIETWTGERTITDGKRTVRLFTMGPTAHTEETVVAWVPDAGVLYQGDSLIVPRGAAEILPGTPLTEALAKLIREKKLAVKTIAGTHGRVATMAELEKALPR